MNAVYDAIRVWMNEIMMPERVWKRTIVDEKKQNNLVSRRLQLQKQAIEDFCRRNHITKLALFGSVLRVNFNKASDIDVLVEFESDHVPGFFRLAAMERELSQTLGKKVDLRTPQDLSKYFRDGVMKSALVQYERV